MHHRSAFLGGQTTGNGTAKKHQRCSPQRSNRVPHRGHLQKQISYDRLPAPKPVRPSSSDFGMMGPPATTTTAVTAVSLAAAATGGITTPQQQKSSVNVVSAFGGTMSPPHQFARKVQPPSRRVDDDDNGWDMSPLPSLKHTTSGDGTPQKEVANGGGTNENMIEDESFMGGTPSFHGGATVQHTPRVTFEGTYTPEQFQLHRIDSTRSMMSGSTVGSASVLSTGRGGRGGRGGRFLARHNSGASVMSRVSAVSAASAASSAASELGFYNTGGNSSTTSFNSDYSSINSSRPSYQPTSSMFSTSFAARSGNSPGRTFGSASAKSRRGMASDSAEPCRPWNPMYHNLLHDRDA